MRQARTTAGPPRGLLRLPPADAGHQHLRVLPRLELRELVAHFWEVSWALATPQTVETLSHPTVHLVFEECGKRRRAEVAGVPRKRFVRTLAGEGRVFGVKFRPGMFRVLYGQPVHRVTGAVVALRELFGEAAADLAREIFAASSMGDRILVAERFLMAARAEISPSLVRLRDLVETIASDSSLVRVEQLADAMGVDRRTLERRFRDAVGVTPKWVIRRYRLHEAAEKLRRGEPVARVAADLEYADQAHFTRDFAAEVGLTPRAFLRRAQSG